MYTTEALARDIKELPVGTWSVSTESGASKLCCGGTAVLMFAQGTKHAEVSAITSIVSNIASLNGTKPKPITEAVWDAVLGLSEVIGDVLPDVLAEFELAIEMAVPCPADHERFSEERAAKAASKKA